MLYKGKRDRYYLYELTDTDLIWEESDQNNYRIGNVLLFANKKDIALGMESLKADDLTTAIDYLEGVVEYVEETNATRLEATDKLKQQLALSESKVHRLDGLLQDLSADLESQRYSNQMLIAQLESLREQVSIEKVSRDEVIGDLEVASAETYRKDLQLKEVIDAKTKLEQELAAQICELLEMDSANAELQKRLKTRNLDDLDTTMSGPSSSTDSLSKTSLRSSSPEAQILTSPTGKQIQIYHEFPIARRGRHRGISAASTLVRTVSFIVVGILIFLAGSVIATAQLNEISFGEALDTTLKIFFP